MAISIEYIELRRAPREIRQAPVSCAIAAAPERHEASLVDVGPGGAGLLLDRPVSPGQSLRIEGIDDGIGEATVRWVRSFGQRFRIGAEFARGRT